MQINKALQRYLLKIYNETMKAIPTIKYMIHLKIMIASTRMKEYKIVKINIGKSVAKIITFGWIDDIHNIHIWLAKRSL